MSRPALDIAVIGYGAMARSLVGSLGKNPSGVRVGAVLVRGDVPLPSQAGLRRMTSVAELVASQPSLVVECASHGAVRDTVPEILAAGIDVVLASVGALADPEVLSALERAAADGGARLTIASGAIGGLDVLRAATLAGLDEVVYSGRKPPAAWRDTPAESLVDLAAIDEPALLFTGTAAEAARLYPKNANVTAAVALAGIGFEKTRVRLYADPTVPGNIHELEASGSFGSFAIRLANKPLPDNPKTSWLAALSVQQAVLRHFRSIEC